MKKFTLFITLLAITFTYSQNLALSKTATASNNKQAASNAVDGNMGTRWETDSEDPQWIAIDLGASYTIDHVILNWEGAYGKAYDIQISNDATFATFTTAYTTTTGDGGTDDLTVSGTGRYIRMYGTERGTPWGYSLYEFQVYAAIPVNTDARLSNLTVSGTTVSGFSASTLTYNVQLAYGAATAPTVVGTPTQAAPATAVTTNANSLPGASTVLVTAQDGATTKTYTVNFTVAGPPVTLPLDFSNPSHIFTYDQSGGTTGTVSIISEKLSVTGNGNDWDNVFITFTSQVDLSNNAANTITFKIKSTTAAAGVEHFHRTKMSGPSGAHELDFTTIGQEEKTVVLDYPAGLGTNYTEFRIFIDAGYGATASAIETYLIDDISVPMVTPATCSDGIKNQDETGIDCGGICGNTCDVTAPAAFTATVGTVKAFSVELLLNATDASGTISYDISYNSGANTAQTTGTSGTQKAFSVSGLTPQTSYSFNVIAKDAAGNVNTTTITVPATTVADTSNACQGFTSEVTEGSFSVGINYAQTTSGTDITFQMELLDTDKPGIAPEVFIPGFGGQFFGMTLVSGQTYTKTVSGFSAGDITFSYRIAYAGGLVRSKNFIYTLGDTCGTAGLDNLVKFNFSIYPNPANDIVQLKATKAIGFVEVYDLTGRQVIKSTPNSNSKELNVSSLSKGLYIVKVSIDGAVGTTKLLKQ